MSGTDEECVRQCLDGHPEAFGSLVERYHPALLSYLSGRLRDREKADEMAQEAWVRSYFALSRLKKPESFFSWLLGIAGRVAMEQQRGEIRQKDLLARVPVAKADPPPAQDYALESAVAELQEPYREVILLHYYGRMSCDRVAERLGISVAAVAKRLSRAYSMLRLSLGAARKREQVSP